MIKATGVAEVTDADFESEVVGAGVPVLVKFTADWCGPCRQLAPVLSDIAREEGGRLKIVQLDVDANPRTTIAYGVLSTPTLMLFLPHCSKGVGGTPIGEPVKSMVGARPKRRLLEELADVL
jgi:thioredoxin 1